MNKLKVSSDWKDYVATMGYCGCFCGGCPAFHVKRCHGCRSEIKKQARISKWKCRIRNCVIDRDLKYCSECENFIKVKCQIRKRLVKNYSTRYSIDLDENSLQMKDMSEEEWIKQQLLQYKCKFCGSIFSPYDFQCFNCNKKNQ